MTDHELMQLLRAFHKIEVEGIEAELARKRSSCLSLIRARALALNPRLWTEVEREHVADCDSCSRLVERLERGVLHPPLWTLARWSAGVLVDGEARTIQDHLEKDECQRCYRFLESAWLRALVELVKAGHANLKEAHGLTDAVVSPLAPLPAPMGAFGARSRSPFLLEARQAESALSAALRETDDGELMLYIQTPDAALAGRTVHVEVLGEGEPLTATVSLTAEVGDGCSGQQTFGRFDEVAAQLGKDCIFLAVLTGDNGSSPARTADPSAEGEGRRKTKTSNWINKEDRTMEAMSIESLLLSAWEEEGFVGKTRVPLGQSDVDVLAIHAGEGKVRVGESKVREGSQTIYVVDDSSLACIESDQHKDFAAWMQDGWSNWLGNLPKLWDTEGQPEVPWLLPASMVKEVEVIFCCNLVVLCDRQIVNDALRRAVARFLRENAALTKWADNPGFIKARVTPTVEVVTDLIGGVFGRIESRYGRRFADPFKDLFREVHRYLCPELDRLPCDREWQRLSMRKKPYEERVRKETVRGLLRALSVGEDELRGWLAVEAAEVGKPLASPSGLTPAT